MATSKLFFSIAILIFTASCATNQKSRIAMTASAFAVGGAVGAASAPKDERQDMHAFYWGGILGAIAAVASNYIYNDEKELEKINLENDKLKAQMDLIQNSKTLLKQGKGYFKSGTGEEYFQSGKATWKLYQVDRWVKDGPNKLYHQDKMVEISGANEEK